MSDVLEEFGDVKILVAAGEEANIDDQAIELSEEFV